MNGSQLDRRALNRRRWRCRIAGADLNVCIAEFEQIATEVIRRRQFYRCGHRGNDGALDAVTARIGKDAFTKPELKSPAQIAELGPAAAAVVKEFAYTPNTGLTIAPASSKKGAVKVDKTVDVYAHLIPTETNGDNNVE